MGMGHGGVRWLQSFEGMAMPIGLGSSVSIQATARPRLPGEPFHLQPSRLWTASTTWTRLRIMSTDEGWVSLGRVGMRARVFLDFDGVLNPEAKLPPGPFTDWCTGKVDGVTVKWSPTVALAIGRLATRAEVLCLTTWEEDAQIHLEPLIYAAPTIRAGRKGRH